MFKLNEFLFISQARSKVYNNRALLGGHELLILRMKGHIILSFLNTFVKLFESSSFHFLFSLFCGVPENSILDDSHSHSFKKIFSEFVGLVHPSVDIHEAISDEIRKLVVLKEELSLNEFEVAFNLIFRNRFRTLLSGCIVHIYKLKFHMGWDVYRLMKV